MTNDDVPIDELHEILKQTRFELDQCKKGLKFKELLLCELEMDNSELLEKNTALESDLKKLLKLRREPFESESSDEGLEDGWSSNEDAPKFQNTMEYNDRHESAEKVVGDCDKCKINESMKDELHAQLDELHQQLTHLQNVNQLLQSDLDKQTNQIVKLSENLTQEEERNKELQSHIERLKVEKEFVEKDLKDFHDSSLMMGRYSDINCRGPSIGSSIGDELGLQALNFGEPPNSTYDWSALLEEPEMIDVCRNLEHEESFSARLTEDCLGDLIEDSVQATHHLESLPADRVETNFQSESIEPLTTEWTNSYTSDIGFRWQTLTCCVPFARNRKPRIFDTRPVKKLFSARSILEFLFRRRN